MWRASGLWSGGRPSWVLAFALGSAGTLAALAAASCTGSGTSGTTATSATPDPSSVPSVRLYLLSNVAGALVPCGCSKDQLGGADHFAAFIQSEKARVPSSLIAGAGPLFFQEPTLSGDGATQARWKAEALARSARELGIVAWAPGTNDFAAGLEDFKKLQADSGIAFLASNVKGDAALSGVKMTEISGVKIALVGVAEPSKIAGLDVGSAGDALKREVQSARSQGARIVVALASVQRGDALRLIDAVPDVDVLVVGKPTEKGDLNDAPKPPTITGQTLVVETSNHLQTVAVLDLFLREPQGAAGRITLADGGGVARAEQLLTLSRQIRDLETRINGWEKDKAVNAADLNARRNDLQKLRAEKAQLESVSDAPPPGSYFKYAMVEVRDKLGEDKAVADLVLAYYKRVNEHNKGAFKDRLPKPAAEGEASFIGVDQCSSCHAEERAVWDKTDHARAYPTLEAKSVEFNLDCVSCHVTGYDRPGGSTVTHVETLKNVQCETCHGPGSLHAKDPTKKGLVTVKPDPRSCVSECHHPPHVENFDPVAKNLLILGPGHGR